MKNRDQQKTLDGVGSTAGLHFNRRKYMLPDDFVKKGIKLAKGSMLFGIKFDDMTRDELIAAAAHGWNEERKQRENYAETATARAHFFVEMARRA